MFTADMARKLAQDDLDGRIEKAVKESYGNSAYLRVYAEDSFCWTIKEELEKRGFTAIDVPDIIIKGDVYFEW